MLTAHPAPPHTCPEGQAVQQAKNHECARFSRKTGQISSPHRLQDHLEPRVLDCSAQPPLIFHRQEPALGRRQLFPAQGPVPLRTPSAGVSGLRFHAANTTAHECYCQRAGVQAYLSSTGSYRRTGTMSLLFATVSSMPGTARELIINSNSLLIIIN